MKIKLGSHFKFGGRLEPPGTVVDVKGAIALDLVRRGDLLACEVAELDGLSGDQLRLLKTRCEPKAWAGGLETIIEERIAAANRTAASARVSQPPSE